MDLKTQNESVAGSDPPPGGSHCWCGGADLEALRPDYGSCRACGTVVYSEPYDPLDYAGVTAASFYGDRYWRQHVPEHLGLPGLEERARGDLPERAVFHLAKVLRRVAPGARVLELGCGSGSLTYLLRQAGFDAVGLELGPAAIELARRRFGIEVCQGPLETAELEGSFDAVLAVDVLEHLPRPLATLELCAARLRKGGTLLLQTPCYRDQGADWEMLVPREHLFLFTAESVERLLRAAGFTTVEIGDSLFPHDMWIDAARGSLARRADPEGGVAPIALALIDAHDELETVREELAGVDADRQAKERNRRSLADEVAEVRGDQEAKEQLIERLTAELAEVRQDQAAKGEAIERLNDQLAAAQREVSAAYRDLAAVHGELAAAGEQAERSAVELRQIRAEAATRAELIERSSAELAAVRDDHAARGELIERLNAELAEVRGDHAARGELIERLSAELVEVRDDQRAKERVIATLDGELARRRDELQEIHADRLYRGLRTLRSRLGRGAS